MRSLEIYNIEGAGVGENDFSVSLLGLKTGTEAGEGIVVSREAWAK